jgi:hypothetical protein
LAPALCGTGQCVKGKYACAGNLFTCVDAGTPTEEACDGVDNDCDGTIDDIATLGDACTTLGGCPGTLQCDAELKKPVCVKTGMDNPEICNGIDDDCDGSIDEIEDIEQNDDRLKQPCDATSPAWWDRRICTSTTPSVRSFWPSRSTSRERFASRDGVAALAMSGRLEKQTPATT